MGETKTHTALRPCPMPCVACPGDASEACRLRSIWRDAEVFLRLNVSASAKAEPGLPAVTVHETFKSTAEVFPVELKDMQLADPQLMASDFRQVCAMDVKLSITTKSPLFVSACGGLLPSSHENDVPWLDQSNVVYRDVSNQNGTPVQ